MSQKWSRTEAQVVLAVNDVARNTSDIGRKHLILNDSAAPIFVVAKGRSSSPGMRRCCRRPPPRLQ
eukprot:1448448-Pyramimonas_sp.AAC.1